MFGSTPYKLSLTKNYVSRWGMVEAVRELIQNAIDSDSPFQYYFEHTAEGQYNLHLRSEFTTLLPSTLLLGATSKADSEDKIGSFGEGYKLALLVLTRLGYKTIIQNGNKVWSPGFEFDKKFCEEILVIWEAENPIKHSGLTFSVFGLSSDDTDQIINICLKMQSDIGRVIYTERGYILLDRPGELYVGDLFVCKTELVYGYNIFPKYLKLERDRQTVDGFDLKYTVKEMWFDSKQWDDIAGMIENSIPDLEYAQYGSPEIVKEACYRRFKAKYPGHIAVKTQAELDELIKKGLTSVVVISNNFHSNISESKGYKADTKLPPVETPERTLTDWLEQNKRHMRRCAIVNFEQLIAESAKWRKR